MLINKNKKFCFLLVPKTATHVLKETFTDAYTPFGWHETYRKCHNLDNNLYEDIKLNYEKYLFIRNPWSHAVSQYFHDIDNHRFLKQIRNRNIENYSTFESYLTNSLYTPQSLNSFNDKFFVNDHYLQVENLQEELIRLTKKYGYKYKEIDDKKSNKTKIRTNYFNHQYPDDYRKLYTNDKMIQIVEELSKNEINKFNYKF